jgi:hypothetical protein
MRDGPLRGAVYGILFSLPIWAGIGIAVWWVFYR